MNEDKIELKEKFNDIIKLGWVESHRTDYGAIGITFENLIGVNTNEFEIPDFGSIEIKTKCKSKFEYINLFNCVPTGPHYHEVERIKDLFGYPDSKIKKFKVLNVDVFCKRINKIGMKFYFKLNIYKQEKKIKLSVYDIKRNKIEEETYWDFDILEEKLNRKLTYLALINADKKIVNKKHYFKYKEIKIYKLKGFDTFINLLENDYIKITFKIGIFRDKKRLGKIHDRGTSFSIKKKDIQKLFEFIE